MTDVRKLSIALRRPYAKHETSGVVHPAVLSATNRKIPL